jgi:hypothetical protein
MLVPTLIGLNEEPAHSMSSAGSLRLWQVVVT